MNTLVRLIMFIWSFEIILLYILVKAAIIGSYNCDNAIIHSFMYKTFLNVSA